MSYRDSHATYNREDIGGTNAKRNERPKFTSDVTEAQVNEKPRFTIEDTNNQRNNQKPIKKKRCGCF